MEAYTINTRAPVPTVVYIVTAQELDAALQDFKGPYGFDCEWKCMPVTGRVALVQLSNGSKVLLVHVSGMPEFPARLKAILEDATAAKVGVSLESDKEKLRDNYGVMAKGLINLGPLAARVDAAYKASSGWRGASLAITVAHFLRRTLPKGPVRQSNWERVPLTDEQREYAAGDAHCALEVYKILMARVAASRINLSSCRHKVTDETRAYDYPDRYPLDAHRGKGIESEYHPYLMWYHGYNIADIQQTMVKYRDSLYGGPEDEVAVISAVVKALTRDTTLSFDAAALRAFVESNTVTAKKHEAFLAAQCPIVSNDAVSESDLQPVASSSKPAVLAGKKRKARSLTPDDDSTPSMDQSGHARRAASKPVPSIQRRSRRLQSTSLQESSGPVAKRTRTAKP